MIAERHRARARGRRAEWVAALWLRMKGYAILARSFTSGRGTGAGEVDIVARRGDVVAFVEVKNRASAALAAEAIGPHQQRRIIRGAQAFLARRPDLAHCTLRFDAILVAPWHLRHISDAWRKDA